MGYTISAINRILKDKKIFKGKVITLRNFVPISD